MHAWYAQLHMLTSDSVVAKIANTRGHESVSSAVSLTSYKPAGVSHVFYYSTFSSRLIVIYKGLRKFTWSQTLLDYHILWYSSVPDECQHTKSLHIYILHIIWTYRFCIDVYMPIHIAYASYQSMPSHSTRIHFLCTNKYMIHSCLYNYQHHYIHEYRFRIHWYLERSFSNPTNGSIQACITLLSHVNIMNEWE